MLETLPLCLLHGIRQFLPPRQLALCRRVSKSWKHPVCLSKLVLNLHVVPVHMLSELYDVKQLFSNVRVLFVSWCDPFDFSVWLNLRFLGANGGVPTWFTALPTALKEISLGHYCFGSKKHMEETYNKLGMLPKLQKIHGFLMLTIHEDEVSSYDAIPLRSSLKETLDWELFAGDSCRDFPLTSITRVCMRLKDEIDNNLVKEIGVLPKLEFLKLRGRCEVLDYPPLEWTALQKVELDLAFTSEIMQILVTALKLHTLTFTSRSYHCCLTTLPLFPQVHTIIQLYGFIQANHRHLVASLFPNLKTQVFNGYTLQDEDTPFPTLYLYVKDRKLDNLYIQTDNCVNIACLKHLSRYANRIYVSAPRCSGRCSLSNEAVWYLPFTFRASLSEISNVCFLESKEMAVEFEKFSDFNSGALFDAMALKYK